MTAKRTPEEKAILRKKRALEAKQVMTEKGRAMISGIDGWVRCGGGIRRTPKPRKSSE